jgi:hypothetical protein
MKDKDKLVTLIRLRDVLYFGVRPTLRQCGFPPEIIRDLAKEGLIKLGDKKFGDATDRYVIEEILPAGLHESSFHLVPALLGVPESSSLEKGMRSPPRTIDDQ